MGWFVRYGKKYNYNCESWESNGLRKKDHYFAILKIAVAGATVAPKAAESLSGVDRMTMTMAKCCLTEGH